MFGPSTFGVLAAMLATASAVTEMTNVRERRVAGSPDCVAMTPVDRTVRTTVTYADAEGVHAGNRGRSLYQRHCNWHQESATSCDYTFACVMELGFLEDNTVSNAGPLEFSEIRPSTSRLEGPLDSLGWSWPDGSDGKHELARDAITGLMIHTPGKSNVAIQDNYDMWKYFYQEKGRTQVFRLFAGAYNVRNANRGQSAGRVEAHSDSYTWRYRNTGRRNKWYQFQALYTIVDPQDAHIFQVFSADTSSGKALAWTVTLSMLADGRIVYLQRGHGIVTGTADDEHRLTTKVDTGIMLARGGQFALCVRDDGRVTETWALHGDALRGSLAGAACGESPWQLLGRYEGDVRRRQNDAYDWKYRWGTYVQSKKTLEPTVVNTCADSLVFISGVNMKKVPKASN